MEVAARFRAPASPSPFQLAVQVQTGPAVSLLAQLVPTAPSSAASGTAEAIGPRSVHISSPAGPAWDFCFDRVAGSLEDFNLPRVDGETCVVLYQELVEECVGTFRGQNCTP